MIDKWSSAKCLILLISTSFVLCLEECRPQKLKCPQIKSLEIIDIKAINGTWYEHSNSNYLSRKCTKFEFKSFLAETYFEDLTPLKLDAICNFRLGSYFWSDSGPVIGCYSAEARKFLLAIDYAALAIWYSCDNLRISEHIMILTRQRKPTEQTLSVIKELLVEYGFSALNFTEINQNNCAATVNEKNFRKYYEH